MRRSRGWTENLWAFANYLALGEVLAEAGESPGVIVADLDLAKVDEARSMVPSLTHDREYVMPEALRLAGE